MNQQNTIVVHFGQTGCPTCRSSARRARFIVLNVLVSGFLLGLLPTFRPTVSMAAEGCPQSDSEIATDRPDVTNSSFVVPVGSLQIENGINLTSRDSSRTLDQTNTRLRLGIAPCLEVLLDAPSYFAVLNGDGHSGFSNLMPAFKWQVGPLPGQIDIAAIVGLGLPTGTRSITGPGVHPYLQLPWSRALGEGWGISGMMTAFFSPSDSLNKVVTEYTVVLEREVAKNAALFVEYVGDVPQHAAASQLLNSGGLYRVTRTQQIDFHAALGLNQIAPTYIVGVGYSFRYDGFFSVAQPIVWHRQ